MKRKAGWLSQLYIWVVLAVMYLPMLVVVAYSSNSSRYSNWEGFSLQWYEELFNNSAIVDPLNNSIILAFFS